MNIEEWNTYAKSTHEMAERLRRDMPRTDIEIEHDGGSIVILRGTSDVGRDWIEQHCCDEGWNPFGCGARLVEPRYILPIVEGAQRDGLRLAVRA